MRKVIGILFVLVGAGLLTGSGLGYVTTRRWVDRAARAPGTVVRLERGDMTEETPGSTPIVRYTTVAGAPIEFKSKVSSNPPAYSPGDTITVLYHADRPDRAEIDGFFALWFLPLLCGILGAVFSGIGAGLLLLGQRRDGRVEMNLSTTRGEVA